jgi:hypothetical protein
MSVQMTIRTTGRSLRSRETESMPTQARVMTAEVLTTAGCGAESRTAGLEISADIDAGLLQAALPDDLPHHALVTIRSASHAYRNHIHTQARSRPVP